MKFLTFKNRIGKRKIQVEVEEARAPKVVKHHRRLIIKQKEF